MDDCVMWCTACGKRFTEKQTAGVSECPACGCRGVPCDPRNDLAVEINWHELRILGIWSSNWAHEKCDDSGTATLRGILSRLERQYPDLTPLTLGGEMRQVRQSGLEIESTTVPSEGMVIVNGPGAVGHVRQSPEAEYLEHDDD